MKSVRLHMSHPEMQMDSFIFNLGAKGMFSHFFFLSFFFFFFFGGGEGVIDFFPIFKETLSTLPYTVKNGHPLMNVSVLK